VTNFWRYIKMNLTLKN